MDLPARISKYELQQFLGGGMSHVFRAQDTLLGRTVAVKILTPAGVADPDVRARFLQEARMASSISHDNIMCVYDFGEEQGRPYMVMEFLQGQDLRGAIKNNSIPTISAKLAIAEQLARALAHIHAQGIVHRDIKPENVHLDANGRAKLMDFGIAKAADLSLTQPGYVLGTPYYMSPEQVLGKAVNPLMDVYSFGVLLFEMLAGERPFGGATIEQIFYKILHEPLDLSALARAGIPPRIIDIVRRCTEKEPEKRYRNFDEVAAALHSDAAPPPSPRKKKAISPLIFAGAAFAILAVLAVMFWPGSKPPATPVARVETPPGMVSIPAGPFLFGADKQSISLPAYYMDETVVDNAHYAQFCASTNHALPPGFKADRPDLPVVDVTAADARAYAQWAGKRLPSPQEWEKAARGANGFKYPWGDREDATRADVIDNPALKTHVLHPAGEAANVSPYGLKNMAGNCWQIIEEKRTPSPQSIRQFAYMDPPATGAEPWCSMRGGSFNAPFAAAVVYESVTIPERNRSPEIGFRCAKNSQ
jgi:serine/threonine protein kinase